MSTSDSSPLRVVGRRYAAKRSDLDAPETDERLFNALVARMRGGDQAAFTRIYRQMQPGLLRYVTVLVGYGDADDVVAEAWTQALRDLHRFNGDWDGFRAWITTIARHRAMDHLRAASRRPGLLPSAIETHEPAAGDLAAEGAEERMSTAAALDLIMRLPTDQAEAVLLRAVIGLDAKSAGTVLGKRAGAVRTSAYRGLRALAAMLDPGSDTNGPSDADVTS